MGDYDSPLLPFLCNSNQRFVLYHFQSIFWYPFQKAYMIGYTVFPSDLLTNEYQIIQTIFAHYVNFDCLLTLSTSILLVPFSLKLPCCFHVLSMLYVASFWRASLKANKGNVYSVQMQICVHVSLCVLMSPRTNFSAYFRLEFILNFRIKSLVMIYPCNCKIPITWKYIFGFHN